MRELYEMAEYIERLILEFTTEINFRFNNNNFQSEKYKYI